MLGVMMSACGLTSAQPTPPAEREGRPGPGARRERPLPPEGERDLPARLEDREGPPGGAGPFRGRPRPWLEYPEVEQRQIEKFIEENFPRIYVELRHLKDQNVRRYNFRMTRMAMQMKRIMETIKVDPQRGLSMIRERQVEMDIFQAVQAYRQADNDAARLRIKGKLTELAAQAFDFRHERRQEEIQDLEARLDLLKTRLADSEAMKSELIRRHVEDILSRPSPPSNEDEEPPPPPPDEAP